MTIEQSACYIADLAYARGTVKWHKLHDRALGELKRHSEK